MVAGGQQEKKKRTSGIRKAAILLVMRADDCSSRCTAFSRRVRWMQLTQEHRRDGQHRSGGRAGPGFAWRIPWPDADGRMDGRGAVSPTARGVLIKAFWRRQEGSGQAVFGNRIFFGFFWKVFFFRFFGYFLGIVFLVWKFSVLFFVFFFFGFVFCFGVLEKFLWKKPWFWCGTGFGWKFLSFWENIGVVSFFFFFWNLVEQIVFFFSFLDIFFFFCFIFCVFSYWVVFGTIFVFVLGILGNRYFLVFFGKFFAKNPKKQFCFGFSSCWFVFFWGFLMDVFAVFFLGFWSFFWNRQPTVLSQNTQNKKQQTKSS